MEQPLSAAPTLYRRGGRWYAKVKYPAHHPERGGRKTAWRNVPTGEPATTRAPSARVLAAAEALQRRLDEGLPLRDAGAGPAAAVTVQALCDRFLVEYARSKIKDLPRYRALAARHLRTLVYPLLGERLVATVRTADVEVLAQGLRAAGKAERTVHQALARLSAVFTWALRIGVTGVERNPCKGVERGAVAAVEEHLALPEVQQLLAVDPLQLRPARRLTWYMVVVGLYTGLRLGELRALPWSCINLVQRTLDVQHNWTPGRLPKGGKARQLPLHPELLPHLSAWRACCPAPEGLLFPARGRAASERGGYNCRALRALCAEVGLRVLRPHPWHGLRHTLATHLDQATGGNAAVVSAVLGHARKGEAVTLVYIHGAGLSYLADELRKLTYLPRVG